jgi:hypothetical protein
MKCKSHPEEVKMVVRGGLGEPCCSQACYNKAGNYISAVMMKNQSGVCGICQRPVQASLAGTATCAVVPYEGVNLLICEHCSSQGKAYLQSYSKCCMCQKPI